MSRPEDASPRSTFRQFFFRGLGILLPTLLTIWILVAVYNFVDQKIAAPINEGVRWSVLKVQPWWPPVTEQEKQAAREGMTPDERGEYAARQTAETKDAYLVELARHRSINKRWNTVVIGRWAVLDLAGLVIAILLIYTVGRVLGGFLGRRLYAQLESVLKRLPVFKQVYPFMKQITDFFVGDKSEKLKFNKVAAVEYPRKGLWSVGLLTGDTMRTIRDAAGKECVTVFIPSSPTPFTGYVITVPKEDMIELPISIDDAMRFVVSGGVIVPDSQLTSEADQPLIAAFDEAKRGRESQPITPG